MKNIDISVVIPVYNEEINIPSLITGLREFILGSPSISFEIVFVDDGSSDSTVSLIQELSCELSARIRIVKLSRNFGSYNALRAGVLYSTGSVVTFTYADLQDPLELISAMYSKMLAGSDIVIAQRESTEYKKFESMFSRVYAKTIRKMAIPDFPNRGVDVVMFNQKVKLYLNNHIESNSSIVLQILYSGYKKTFVSYKKKVRVAGKSKWTISKKIKFFIDSVVGYSYMPLRFISVSGMIMSFFGFCWVVYLLILKITGSGVERGWTALISVIVMGFGMILIALGIIAEYLWRTLEASRGRPVFIIDELIDDLNEESTTIKPIAAKFD